MSLWLSVSTTTISTRPLARFQAQLNFRSLYCYNNNDKYNCYCWFGKSNTAPFKRFSCYAAAKPQSKKRSTPYTSKKKKPNTTTNNNNNTNSSSRSTTSTSTKNLDIDEYDDDDDDDDVNDVDVEVVGASSSSKLERYQPLSLPKPPAGFVVDDQGRVLMASNKRIVIVVDSTNNLPLECIIRRVFKSSTGDECMLLCPVDTPVQILKSTNIEGWSAVSDEEVAAVLPTAAYALAKIHMHLVHSGFCYTARGGFCYTENDIFKFHTDDGKDIDGLPTEGIEITCFHFDGSHYMIYTPSDPLHFVSVKDNNGVLQIANDELLEDPATVCAIDEDTEFDALVEEEAAHLESLWGKR